MDSDDQASIGSVTILLEGVKNGLDAAAAQKLYERYFRQIEWIARGKMGGLKRRIQDEEDLAITVLGQFFLSVRKGQFPKLDDRHDLWQVLLVILERRVIDQRRKKSGKEVGESVILGTDPEGSRIGGMNEVAGLAPTPEELEICREQIDTLLRQLPKEKWRQVAKWKLEQRTNAKIAQLLDCSVRQVERILEGIREIWRPSVL